MLNNNYQIFLIIDLAIIDQFYRANYQQMEKADEVEMARKTLKHLDHFYHLRQFQGIKKSKIQHLKQDFKLYPQDYRSQLYKSLVQTLYLYFITAHNNALLYIYKNHCIDRWGTLFRYYSIGPSGPKFMQLKRPTQFKEEIVQQFRQTFQLLKKYQKAKGKIRQSESETQQNHNKTLLSPWQHFCHVIYAFYEGDLSHINEPKAIIQILEDTEFMKENILILSTLSSTIYPCITENKSTMTAFSNAHQNQFDYLSKFLGSKSENNSSKDFVKYVIRFLKALNDHKVIGITTTLSEKSILKCQENESLLTQFSIGIDRPSFKNEMSSKQQDAQEPLSNKSSQHEYSQGNKNRGLKNLNCRILWSLQNEEGKDKQLLFKICLYVKNNIYKLYFSEIEVIWHRLSQKWKVLLDENKQLLEFSPSHFDLQFDKELNQIYFSCYLKYFPGQFVLGQLIFCVDKLIIAVLALRNIICYYEEIPNSRNISEQKIRINDGTLQDLAKSAYQCTKNYYNYYGKAMNVLKKFDK